jgi:hypothetical protein
MKDQTLRDIAIHAMKNRKSIMDSAVCGCFSCKTIFSNNDIVEWTDWGETAICPKCGVDTVLPQSAGVTLDTEHLSEIAKFLFGK